MPTNTTPYRSWISGTGHYLPEKHLTNQDLEKIMDTNHEWIVERTGIHSRRIAAEGETTTDMALAAAKQALEAANLKVEDIDMIIFGTLTGDYIMPSSACVLQSKLGARNIMAFDLSAACSGFVYGVSVADQFIRTGMYKHVLVIGAEVLHNYINYEDRGTAILFGDAAGAAIVSRVDNESQGLIYSSHMHAEGNLADLLTLPASGSAKFFTPESVKNKEHTVHMDGRQIFKHAVRTMASCCMEALEANEMTKEQVDWIIPHQANTRIMEAVAKYLGVSMEKFVVRIEDMGNTSAATVPVALDTAIRDGRIQRGQTVLLTAFGAGLTSGSVLLKY